MEYKMGLQSKYFNLIKKSEKIVEARLNDAKRQKLNIIVFLMLLMIKV